MALSRTMNALSKSALAVLFILTCGFSACQHLETRHGSAAKKSQLSAKELDLIRQQLAAHPLPEEPEYLRTKQPCFFFIEHPADESMIPVGLLQRHAYVIVRDRDGEWMDVQLTSGQLGSVMSLNMRDLTSAEEASRQYLEPQPELQPLALPQANAEGATIDPVLLGG